MKELFQNIQNKKGGNNLDQMTKEVFEPELENFAREQFLKDCIYDIQNETKFKIQKCERRGLVKIEDLGNDGKRGCCSFELHLVKDKTNGIFNRWFNGGEKKEVEKGSVVIEVSGIFELNKNGEPQFIREQYKYDPDEFKCKTLRMKVDKGKKHAASTAKIVIPLAMEVVKFLNKI